MHIADAKRATHFFFKETERRVCWQEKRKQIRAFKRQKWVCIALFFIFRCLVKCRTFVLLSMLLSGRFHILGCTV